MINKLLEITIDFLNGELSADDFAHPYMLEWKKQRDAGALTMRDDRLLEVSLSIICFFADMYYQRSDKNPEKSLDEQELCLSVHAFLVSNGIIKGTFSMNDLPVIIRNTIEQYISYGTHNPTLNPETYKSVRKPILLKRKPCPAARFKNKKQQKNPSAIFRPL